MNATVLHARIDPRRLGSARVAVHDELAPHLLSCAGSRHGYWMADRSTGRLLAISLWEDHRAQREASAVHGRVMAEVAERIGLDVLAVQRFAVAGAHEEAMSAAPDLRWVRVTWVDGLQRDVRGQLPALFSAAIPDQARTRGFCASYWLVDPQTDCGVGVSCWEGPAELSAGELASRRRRERFEQVLGCRVSSVNEYEALGVTASHLRSPGGTEHPVAAPPSVPVAWSAAVGEAVADMVRTCRYGTTLQRPPGALLAVEGDPTREVTVLLGGSAAQIDRKALRPVLTGTNLGARGVWAQRAHTRTVVATAPVRLHVLSRAEFVDLAREAPGAAEELFAHDLEVWEGVDPAAPRVGADPMVGSGG